MSDMLLRALYDLLEYYKGEMMKRDTKPKEHIEWARSKMEETIKEIEEHEASLRNQR